MIQWNSANWFDGAGNSLCYEDVMEIIKNQSGICDIHVGADSQPAKGGFLFAVTICMHKVGKGAFYFVTKKHSYEQQYKNLGIRLYHESELSVTIADIIRTLTGNLDITVHADVNSDPMYKSSKYSERVQSLIKSMGFKCMIKPNSWAAWVADKHVK